MPYTTTLQQKVIRYCNALLLQRITPSTAYMLYSVIWYIAVIQMKSIIIRGNSEYCE